MTPLGTLFDFSGRSVLVTGASGGLGSGIASVFAEAGARIFIHYYKDREGAQALQESLPGPMQHVCLQADGSSEEDVLRCMQEIASLCGESGLSVLVNNAGVYPSCSLVEMGLSSWQRVMNTNLTSIHLFTMQAANIMKHGSSIINIASIEGLRPVKGHAHYAVSKAAAIHYTMAAALELAPRGIRVNAISPGLVDRPGLASEWPEGYAKYCATAPLGRTGHAREIGYACLFLASKAADWITGTNLIVDGGVSARAAQDYDLVSDSITSRQ